MENRIFSGDQIAYQDQTLKLMKGVQTLSEEILHSFNTTDSFGRISKSASSAVDGFFSFSYFNYEIDDKLPWASHIHYEKFLGQPYFSLKEINQLMNVEDLLKSLGITRAEFYQKYLHSCTRSQISYLDKTTTAKAIENYLYKVLIDSSVFKQFSKGVIRNLFEIVTDENKEILKKNIRDIGSIIIDSKSLLEFNQRFVEYFVDKKVKLTDNFAFFDTDKLESYDSLSGWLNHYEIYKEAYNEAIKGSSLKTLKEGDLPYFCVNVSTKARGEISYDHAKGEIILYDEKRIPYTTMDELLLCLKSCNSIIVPKALMLSYQTLLHGNMILPKQGSQYVFLLSMFYEGIKKFGIAPQINKLLMVEFDFFKELGTLDTIKIPFKLAQLLSLPVGDITMHLHEYSYIEVSGREFYENYMKKYDEANTIISILQNNRDNIFEQMKIIGFNQANQYKDSVIIIESILQKIKDLNINGKVDQNLIQEKNIISKKILDIKNAFYLHLLQTVMDCKYIEKLNKNSARPYILWLLAINPGLINTLVNNAQIDIFDLEKRCYQNKK